MKYSIEMLVDLPRNEVVRLFQDEDFMKEWQQGFVSITPLEGKPGEVGSTSELLYNIRGKETRMVETILRKDLPDSFDFSYEVKGVYNIANNSFIEEANKTIWKAEHIFRFGGFMAFMSLFMKRLFIKQTTDDMMSFKSHAEAKK